MHDELEIWVPTGVLLMTTPLDSTNLFASSPQRSSKVEFLALSLSHEDFA